MLVWPVLLLALLPHHCSGEIGSKLPGLSSVRAVVQDAGTAKASMTSLPRPETQGILSRITFSWADDFMRRERINDPPITQDGIWRIEDSAKSMYNISQKYGRARKAVSAGTTSSSYRDHDIASVRQILFELWTMPMFQVLTLMYRRELLITGLLKLMHSIVSFIPPFLISALLKSININVKSATDKYRSVILSAVLLAVLCLKTIFDNHYQYHITGVGGGMRRAVSLALYEKLLRLKVCNSGTISAGKLTNLLTMDAQRVDQLGAALNLFWDGALQAAGYTSILLWLLGPAVLVGVAAMIGSVYINMFIMNRLLSTRTVNLMESDRRIRVINEALGGIRTIKSYGWEGVYTGDDYYAVIAKGCVSLMQLIYSTDILSRLRAAEMRTLAESVWYRTLILSLMSVLPSAGSVLTLGVYAYLGNELTPATVFTAMSLFGNLKYPLIVYPTVCNTLFDGVGSLRRLSAFLDTPEPSSYILHEDNPLFAARISNSTFIWNWDQVKRHFDSIGTELSIERAQLRIDDLVIAKGKLTVIFGPVASGKTMLLHALLGELNKLSDTSGKSAGTVTRVENVSYVPQAPWLPQNSIRNIVLFGKQGLPIDWRRYRTVLRACQLVEDLDRLEYGDCTELGEQGATISGGQKQRVSLARAAYDSSRELFILDDPLSALDAEVGRRVFQQCVCGLLGRKTRVLVSSDPSVLRYADHIVLMGRSGGSGVLSILAQGSYDELRQDERFIISIGDNLNNVAEDRPETELDTVGSNFTMLSANTSSAAPCPAVLYEALDGAVNKVVELEPDSLDLCTAEMSHAEGAIEVNSEDLDDDELPVSAADTVLSMLSLEERRRGRVQMDAYAYYLKSANSSCLLLLALISVILSNLSIHSQQWAVAKWAMDKGNVIRPLRGHVFVVGLFAVLTGLTNCVRTWLFYQSGLRASLSIHDALLSTAMKAPLGYFETTPLGRVFIRFSSDLDLIDNHLPTTVAHLVASVVQTLASVISIITVTPAFGLLMPLLICMYSLITRNFVDIASDLKHLEAVTRAPIISYFAETLSGLPVIRSFGAHDVMIRENERRMNLNSAASFAMKVANRWVSFRLDLLGNVLVFVAALLAIYGGASSGASGISLNNAVATTGLLNWVIRNWADTQALMHSVEKVQNFNLNTPAEATISNDYSVISNCSVQNEIRAILNMSHSNNIDTIARHEPLDENWPWSGEIIFANVSMRYSEHLQPVLKNVSCIVSPGETVGIVGRTGSGKSSLFRALLRLTEINSGSVFIDGVDVTTVDLSVLRSRLSIIPQDPVLFAGTIRSNIDPKGTLSEEELWEILQKSHLAALVVQLPLGLDYRVREGGAMFSVGQKQLFCMARALVRKTRILLLDEATSSIDPLTDILVQDTVRNEFRNRNCTVLTVAHRLRTVLESDKILVMQDGAVVEYATPQQLTEDKMSQFSKLLEHQNNGAK